MATYRTLSCSVVLLFLWITSTCNAIIIDIDYTFDQRNEFFATQQRRDALQAAAGFFQELLTDRLSAIIPTEGNRWIARFNNPSTGGRTFIPDLTIPADTLIVYAAGRDLPDQTRGQGGAGSAEAVGGDDQWVETVTARAQRNASGRGATDFGTWGGSIAFDTTTPDGIPRDWNFHIASAPSPGQDDFYSVALHELGHVLGLGLSDSWKTWVDPQTHAFNAPASTAHFGSPIELDDTVSTPDVHWKQDTQSTVYPGGAPQIAIMVPISGGRRQFTELDVAALQDIGWEIASPAPVLLAGDANHDYSFDSLDIVQVLQAGKYLTGTSASWGEGDWNGAPGGRRGSPPAGDGLFDQRDIIAALENGIYRSGPYAARLPIEPRTLQAGQTALAVPEPRALTLLLCGIGACLFGRALARSRTRAEFGDARHPT